MIPRIKSYQPLADFQLLVSFDDGRKVRYDVAEDIKALPAFRDLKTEHGLFENAQLDASRTCIYWNDQIDLPSVKSGEKILKDKREASRKNILI